MITEFFAILALILCLLKYFYKVRPNNFPPGPSGVPILGYVPFLRFPIHKKFGELSKLYGKIFGVVLGNWRVVVVSDAKILKKLFNDDRLMGRPQSKAVEQALYAGKVRGVGLTCGRVYQEQRKFAFKNLKEFGFGQSSMEEHILVEVRDLISQFRKRLNQPVNVKSEIQMSVLNVIWLAVSGERYSHDDPQISTLIEMIAKAFEVPPLIPLVLPKLALAFPKITGFQSAINSVSMLCGFLQKTIDEHRKSLDVNAPRDFIDAYLVEIAKTKDKNSSFYSGEGEKQLVAVLLDLFAAGMDPQASLLSYTILYLATNPHVQDKLHAEIVNEVGTNRLPSLSDRPNTPYAQAVISESLRISGVAPLGLPHLVTETFEFEEYTIPKDTVVVGNLWQMQHDAKYWGDPEAYRPERFITDDGQFKNDEEFCPFSVGKRACAGETLARNEMFLFLTGLVQHFQFAIDQNNKPILESYENGVARAPKPFDVIITERN